MGFWNGEEISQTFQRHNMTVDRQSIWSNVKEIQNRNNFFSACQIISDRFQNRLKIFHEGKLAMFLGSAVKRVCSLVTLTNTEVEFWLQASSTDQ